jgi:hypothetical protein
MKLVTVDKLKLTEKTGVRVSVAKIVEVCGRATEALSDITGNKEKL